MGDYVDVTLKFKATKEHAQALAETVNDELDEVGVTVAQGDLHFNVSPYFIEIDPSPYD